MTSATLSDRALIMVEKLKKLEGLSHITPKTCCEFIGVCPDTQKYIKQKESALDDDEEYQALADQIKELCTNRVSLEDETLTCPTRARNIKAAKKESTTVLNPWKPSDYNIQKI